MPEWMVSLRASIHDEMIVEAETEEEAIENAQRDWTFTEATDWECDSAQQIPEETADERAIENAWLGDGGT